MAKTPTDRAIALAALFQTASLVQRLARHGHAPDSEIQPLLASLFAFDAPDTLAVYGGRLTGLSAGLRLSEQELAKPSNLEATRYVVGLIALGGNLLADATRLQRLGQALKAIAPRLENTPLDHPQTVSDIATVYREQISPMSPRIMVKGESDFLQKEAIAERIRAVLLAGVRAGVLWRQSGGSRLSLLLGRQRLLEATRRMRTQPDPMERVPHE